MTNLELILLISSICWSSQHVVTVFPRELIIKLTNEIFYTYARIVFNMTWYSINMALYFTIYFQSKVLYDGVGIIITLIIRILAIYIMILCLLVAPSQFDIASQRNQKRRDLQQTEVIIDNEIIEKEIQTCCSVKSVYVTPDDSNQVPVYGLSHISRHPMLIGLGLFFASFLLHNVFIVDLFFYVPQILQILLGIIHQEYRMRKDKRYNYYFEHTSIIPFVAMIQGRTSIQWNQVKRILCSTLIIIVLISVAVGIVFALFGKDTAINQISNQLYGPFLTWIYIMFLIIVDIVAICSGKYYRAT